MNIQSLLQELLLKLQTDASKFMKTGRSDDKV